MKGYEVIEMRFCFSKKIRPIISAMRKYGFEEFHFSILEDGITTKEALDSREKYYIQLYSATDKNYGYNVELGGNSVGKHSEETKRKISEAQKGEKNHSFGKRGEDSPSSKKVIDLTSGIEYVSAIDAAEKLGLNFSHVCAVARGKRGSTGGHVFRYLDSGSIVQPDEIAFIKTKAVVNKVLPEYRKYINNQYRAKS